MPKRTKTIIISTAILIIVVLILIPKLNFSSDEQSPQSGSQANRNAVLPVRGHIIKAEKLGNVVLTSGTILANEEVELMSERAGKIVRIAFTEGNSVRKGDLLVKINDAELQAELSRAKFRMELLHDRESRQKQLLDKEAISREDYDVALNELNIARAEVDLIQAQIDETEIKAPFNGVIGLKNVSEGSYVTTSTLIARLQSLNPVKLDFSIPEKYAGSVKSGDEIKFKIVGNETNYSGKVYAIEPKIDPVTRTLKIRGLHPNSDGKILPGSFADIQLVLKEIENAFLVPTQAIVPELKGQKVFLLKNGIAVSQSVETGVRTDVSVQLTSGVTENDTVITSGILQIRPGMPVRISEFN
ncbi:MAG: efflux RND transporter periplasmic adaptor subunit [Ignavibacteriaceae bacterium]